MRKLIIASRNSPLAMWQANHVRSQLLLLYPEIHIDILGITTQGDRILGQALAEIGGKGLFVKELEQALLDGSADLGVHSMKDVPVELANGLVLAAICQREDSRDALVSRQYTKLSDLPAASIVGTSSLRREAQIRARFPQLLVKPLRGNIQTRLDKLDNGDYNAIILAAAGLKRLGLSAQISEYLSPEDSLPAAGQGALGIEIRAFDRELANLLAPLNHQPSAACVSAERSLACAMGGSCQIPLAAYATLAGTILTLQSLLALPDGSRILQAKASAPMQYAEQLGRAVAKILYQDGAQEILHELGV